LISFTREENFKDPCHEAASHEKNIRVCERY
jgi:hypothetical protein